MYLINQVTTFEFMLLTKLDQILSQLKARIVQDYILSGIISLDGLHVAFDSQAGTEDVQRLSAEIVEGIDSLLRAVRSMQLSGPKMLILDMNNGRLLAHFMDSAPKYFLLLLVKPQANLGRAILELERSATAFEKGLQEVPYAKTGSEQTRHPVIINTSSPPHFL